MYLKGLIVEGFKSIAKRTEVDLIDDVNVIMGPNGSGKSNFFECIQWVLGGMSAKQLRASSMEDVIFDGGQNGKASDFAQGTLIFDNKDRDLDIDLDEVAITRKLTRGKGNEYFINYESAKLKDITKLFMNKGIGKNNYAITGQNRITDFISMNPNDMRGVIEEAAGISSFKLKKTELENSISNYNRDLERIDAVISEMERSLKPLKKQIKNAEIYETIRKELDERKLFYYSKRLEDYNKEIDSNRVQYNELVKEKDDYLEEKNTIEKFIENFNQNSESDLSLLSTIEEEKSKLEAIVTDLTKNKIMEENNLNNLNDKKHSMLKNIASLKEASNVEEAKKKNLFESINNMTHYIADADTKIENLSKALDDKNQYISKLNENISSCNSNQTLLAIEQQNKEQKTFILTEKKAVLEENLKSKEAVLNNLAIEEEATRNIITSHNNSILAIKYNLNLYTDIDKQIKALENILNSSQKTEGRKKRTLATKALFKNVSGFNDVLFNIISYDEKYINAIDTLFGGILHHFVVDDTKDAEECISILKKNKIPPANFIILSKIKNNKNKVTEPIDSLSRVADILSYENKYKCLVMDYFANSFIAENSSVAEAKWNETNQKYRISTLDGTLFSSNIIKGGYIQKDSKKLQEEYKTLLEKKKELLSFESEVFNNTYELKGKITLLEKENSINKNTLDKIIKEKSVLVNERESICNELNNCTKSLDNLLKEIDSLSSKSSEINQTIVDYNNSLDKTNKEVALILEERQELILDKSKKETLLEEYEKNYYVYTNSSEEKIGSLQNNIDNVDAQISHIEEKLAQTISQFETAQSNLDVILDKWNNIRDNIEMSRKEKDMKSDRLNKLITLISNIENNITKLDFNYEKIDEKIQLCEEAVIDVPEETEFAVFDEDINEIYSKIQKLEKKIKSLGFINTDAIVEYKELNERYETMQSNKNDLEVSKSKIVDVLQVMQDDMTTKYVDCYNCLNKDLKDIFTKLFNGGSAELIMENPESPLDTGVILKATPPGKKNKALSLLSGGEKSLTAVSFIFALLKFNPSPVVIFDEIDAALDEIKVALLADYITNNKNVQYVIVSHRKPMMKIAKALYGASMNMTTGVTELLSQKL
ncbi:AAA family ATPase [Clostridium perfringens]